MGILSVLDCCNRDDVGSPILDYESLEQKNVPTINNSVETSDTVSLADEEGVSVKDKDSVATSPTTDLDSKLPAITAITAITATCTDTPDDHAKDSDAVHANTTPQPVAKTVSFNRTDCDEAGNNHHAAPLVSQPVEPPTAPKPPLIPVNKDLAELARQCPDATPEERVRFLEAKDGDYKKANKQLRAYLDWRKRYAMDTPIERAASSRSDYQSCCSTFLVSDDENDWDVAAVAAMSVDPDGDRYKGAAFPKLPRLARFDNVDGSDRMLGIDGNRILQLLPAQLDSKLASEETYALTIAFYLDRQLDRHAMEKVSVFVDVRGGHGWSNPPARSTVPFIKQVIAILEQNFPERLSASIVCPMPFAAVALWKMIKVFLDPTTAKKIQVIRGSADRDSKLPIEKLSKLINADVLAAMEKNRLSSCKDKKSKSGISC